MDAETHVPTWVLVVTTVGGLFSGGFGLWIINLYKEWKQGKQADAKVQTETTKTISETRLSENEQAFKIYKDLVETLKKNMDGLTIDIRNLENQYLEAKKENAELRADHLTCQRENVELRATLSSLKDELKQLKIDLTRASTSVKL
jgi:chromosome segregation ATPase